MRIVFNFIITIRKLRVKFHDDRCKGKAIMRHKPFQVINALWRDSQNK